MRIDVRPMRADDPAEIEAARQIYNAAFAEDVPDFPAITEREFEGQIRHPWPGQDQHRWVAELDGQLAGLVRVGLPTLDNLHSANIDLVVNPQHRRHGVGTALYESVVEFCRANDRNTLMGGYVTQLPGGPPRSAAHEAFANRVGAKSALPEVRRRLDLDTVDRSGWDALLADARAHATGYSVVAWTDAAPDDLVAQVAALDSRFLEEAPLGDLKLEAQNIDADRHRRGEETMRLRGGWTYHVGAVHEESGTFAAWTYIAFQADNPQHGWQEITLVHPGHRGMRLGMLVKMENLLNTVPLEPAMRSIDTWNAAENTHMIAINEAMGFRAVDAWVSWQHVI